MSVIWFKKGKFVISAADLKHHVDVIEKEIREGLLTWFGVNETVSQQFDTQFDNRGILEIWWQEPNYVN